MEYTTLAEEIADEYRKKLIEYYEKNNLDPIIIEQVNEFDTEALLCMAAKEGIAFRKLLIEQTKEEQKQH